MLAMLRNPAYGNAAHSLMRAAFGFLFFQHGAQKIFGWFGGNAVWDAGREGFIHYQFMAAGFIEVICGLLILVGLKTRLAATLAALQMLVAYLQFHLFREGFAWDPMNNGGERALLFLFAFAFMATHGGGGMSLDRSMNGSE